MQRLLDRSVQTFTLAFDDPRVDEVRNNRLLSEFFPRSTSCQISRSVCTTEDITRLPQSLWHSEDPHTGGTEVSRLLLAQESARNLKVVLSGEGSDEVFGGYPWFHRLKRLQPVLGFPLRMRRLLAALLRVRRKWIYPSEVLRTPDPLSLTGYKRMIGLPPQGRGERLFAKELRQRLRVEPNGEDSFSLPQDFSRWHPFARLQYLEMNVRLADYIVRYLDTMSMAYSLEVRVPFLDHEFVETVCPDSTAGQNASPRGETCSASGYG